MFFVHTPRVIASLFAGVLVDRFSRKLLMILGDLVAGISTIALLLLFLTNNLQIWHLYCTAAINSLFGFIQGLAYSASLSLLVPPQQYNRATALNSVQMSGAFILAPAFAGGLYPVIGLKGILIIDLATFIIAIATLSVVSIPQPLRETGKKLGKKETGSGGNHRASLLKVPSGRWRIRAVRRQAQGNVHQDRWQELAFGIRYLLQHRSLLAILGFLTITFFIDSFNFAILPAMVLARSNNDPTVWGRLLTTFGIGGVLGATTMSIWNLPKRRINGLLIGNAIWKGGLILLSVTQSMAGKLIAAVVSGFCSPFPGSSSQGIWMSQVSPEIQGRVFAARDLIAGIATPLGAAIAGVLVDNYFQPAMETDSFLARLFGGIFGNSSGAGMACAIALFSFCGMAISLVGYAFPVLRDIEKPHRRV